ncbi:hypothetical protein CVIRNUC_006692 [Coccomyxa viridis]|uniref:Uncharacterized protein n=1 Tax=Coccomyxa viridis TaxID=1274662 RepID=A0AAV1ICA9_9CHLO|nr:hypothetical protein CVIRNUC_006692 [Coccomyxa viridis]
MWSVPSVCSFTPGVHHISLGRMDEDDSQLVLRRIMEDGTFDELRKTVIERLKQDDVLNSFIEEAVLNSKALASTKVDSKESKTDTYNYVRKEIEGKALDRALQATWRVLQDQETGLSASIEQQVHAALCAIYEERVK